MLDWSTKEMIQKTITEKLSVDNIMLMYINDRIFVNRKYQRKLVWNVQEKKDLIDSILRNIPIPALFLVESEVKQTDSDETVDAYEIIDGLQRLNAITSFMLGEFPITFNGYSGYYNPEASNALLRLVHKGKLNKPEADSVLPFDLCMDFASKQLYTIISGKDEQTVNLIFSRINSSGRRISAQDLRQARAFGNFPDLVRRIASDVRLDNTYSDYVSLSDMPKISIGDKSKGYGVDIKNIFWRRHGLIMTRLLCESADEQLIEDLLASILLGNSYKRSKERLDALYNPNSKLGAKIENIVHERGIQNLENIFKLVFDTFEMIFNAVHSDFTSYLFPEATVLRNKDECFRIVFKALYQCIDEGMYLHPDNAAQVAEILRNTDNLFNPIINSSTVDFEALNTYANQLYLLIKPAFVQKTDVVENALVTEIDKRLCYSPIESQMTEFKIGISDFKTGEYNQNVVKKIAKTLVAMANVTSAAEHGMIILGIADSREQYLDWRKVYDQQAQIIAQHYVPGVQAEANKLYNSVDNYFRFLRKEITKLKISRKLKNYILETFRVIDYHGVQLVVFDVVYQDEISLYSGTKYVRQGNETVRVKA